MPTGLLMSCFSGKVNFTVTAEAMEREDVCTERPAVVPESGGKDTVVKHLLVKVRLHCRVLASLELRWAQDSLVGGSGKDESAGEVGTFFREIGQGAILRVDGIGAPPLDGTEMSELLTAGQWGQRPCSSLETWFPVQLHCWHGYLCCLCEVLCQGPQGWKRCLHKGGVLHSCSLILLLSLLS